MNANTEHRKKRPHLEKDVMGREGAYFRQEVHRMEGTDQSMKAGKEKEENL